MQKNVLEKLNAIKSVFAICIEFTFCRTEYLHSCNYTSHFFPFLNSKKIHFIAFLRTYYVHFFRSSLRNEITVLAFVQVKCCMHRMKKRLHQVQVFPNTNCEANNGVENRGKFFDSDYFHFVQSQRKPKQIKARANDIKRVRILIQTDIIAELPPMMIAICSRSVFVFLGLCFWHARLMHPHMCTWSCLLSSEFEFLIWIEMHCTFLMLVDTHTALTHSSWLYQPTHFDTQNESNDEIFRLHEIHKRALCTQSY